MVNNSTNINKTNESLNSDGQQFYQYQHNEQPPLTSKHRTHKENQHTAFKIQALTWDKNNKCGGIYLTSGFPTTSLDFFILTTN